MKLEVNESAGLTKYTVVKYRTPVYAVDPEGIIYTAVAEPSWPERPVEENVKLEADFYRLVDKYPKNEIDLGSLLAHPTSHEANDMKTALELVVYDEATEGAREVHPLFKKLGKLLKVDVDKTHREGVQDRNQRLGEHKQERLASLRDRLFDLID